MVETNLKERQIKLLEAVIEAYSEDAQPVGSKNIVERYKLNVSPATVRNDLAALVEEGFLAMDHGSSGRYPTALGYRYYIRALMQESEVPLIHEIAIKQRLWENRFDTNNLLREASLALSENLKMLAVVSTKDGYVYNTGAFNLLDHPEFLDVDVARAVLHMVDNHAIIEELYGKVLDTSDEVKVLLGEELGLTNLSPCGMIFSEFSVKRNGGTLAVIGPIRMPYQRVIPTIKTVKGLIEEVSL